MQGGRGCPTKGALSCVRRALGPEPVWQMHQGTEGQRPSGCSPGSRRGHLPQDPAGHGAGYLLSMTPRWPQHCGPVAGEVSGSSVAGLLCAVLARFVYANKKNKSHY